MQAVYDYAIPALWVAWFIYWRVAAANVKTTVRREPVWFRALYTCMLIAGASMFSIRDDRLDWFNTTLWPRTVAVFWLGVFVVAAGFAITVWARVALGRNWSATVSLKEGHELVQSGPYALARHPIYTGLLVMFVGTAIAVAELRGVVGLVLILVSFLIKLRYEEKWMIELFAEKYLAYRKRVAMLIPFVW